MSDLNAVDDRFDSWSSPGRELRVSRSAKQGTLPLNSTVLPSTETSMLRASSSALRRKAASMSFLTATAVTGGLDADQVDHSPHSADTLGGIQCRGFW